jgi:hypothetical protein
MRQIKFLISLLAVAIMLVPAAAANAQTPAAPCPAFSLSQSAATDPACDAVPSFKASFINQVWTFDGAVDEVDLQGHTLDMTTSSIDNLPKQFASQDDSLLNQDTHVQFKAATRVYDPDGHRVSQDYLDYAEAVAVSGKLLPPAKWSVNADGARVPTISAKRIYIGSYVDDASQAQDNGDAAGQGDPAAQDPTPGDGVVTTADVEIWISTYLHVHLSTSK